MLDAISMGFWDEPNALMSFDLRLDDIFSGLAEFLPRASFVAWTVLLFQPAAPTLLSASICSCCCANCRSWFPIQARRRKIFSHIRCYTASRQDKLIFFDTNSKWTPLQLLHSR